MLETKCKLCDEKVRYKGLCKIHYARDYYKNNKDKVMRAVRKWQKKNPEKMRKYKQAFFENNPTYAAEKSQMVRDKMKAYIQKLEEENRTEG